MNATQRRSEPDQVPATPDVVKFRATATNHARQATPLRAAVTIRSQGNNRGCQNLAGLPLLN